jgi:DNA (cytosine-5)-methyltransferase 1
MSKNGKRRARSEKLSRLCRGHSPRVLDLFAGCGGLSLGFSNAGFEITAGLEINDHASQTHAENFFSDEDKTRHHGKGRDIRETEPEELFRKRGSGEEIADKIDVIVGGPPCQSFARVGRAKLREVDENPEAFLDDSRGNLYLRYLDYVRKLEPLAIVIENVPDALNYGDHNIAEEISEVLDELGYTCRYTLLNSAFYGVPQMRERMFLIAYVQELESRVKFPEPTHWIELPSGYHGSRSVALKLIRRGSLFENGGSQKGHFTEIPKASKEDLPRAVTAKEALDDLPDITHHLEGNLTRGARRFNDLQPYPENVELNDYARLMRNWPGFESHDGIYDHRSAIRNLPRDYPIFRLMEAGDQYPEAHRKALKRFEEKLEEKRQEGYEIPEGSEEYEELKSSIVPPYDPSKFPNKWRKMEKDEPARTLTAHIGKDTYSHIHYDSDQARTISVREAARLQSFPDGFEFAGTMNPAFRQIGNAVPPLLAHAVALEVASALNVNATSIVSQFDFHA